MMGRFRFAVIGALPIPSALPKMHIREGIVEVVCSELFILYFPKIAFLGSRCENLTTSFHRGHSVGRMPLAPKHVLL